MSVYPGIDDERVVQVPSQTGPGYKLQPGSKISFSSAPAGTLQVTKRENGVISTASSSFAGGTLELTDPDILDAKIVDGSGNALFQLGYSAGSNVFDYRGGLVGTITGAVSPVIRRAVYALELDGTGYVDCGNDSSFDFDYATWCLDINISRNTGSTFQMILTKGVDGWELSRDNHDRFHNRFNDSLGTVGDLYGNTSLPLSQRANLISKYDGTNCSFYYNGNLDTEWSRPYVLAKTTKPIVIGDRSGLLGTLPYYGLIHLPVIIYPRALSESEIKLLTQRRFDEVSRQDCVLWLDYDEDYYTSTGKLKDLSGNGNHGTLNGGVSVKKVML